MAIRTLYERTLDLNFMLLLLQQAILKAPPTITDSLKHSLAQMQHKVDSLEKVVVKTEIGTGFFSEIIALQLGVFLFLVSIAGWFGWGYFRRTMEEYTTTVDNKFTTMVNEQRELFDAETKAIKKSLWQTTFNVNRAMYKALMSDSDPETLFYWSLSASHSLQIWNPKNVELLFTWLNLSKNEIDAISVPTPEFRHFLKKDLKTLEALHKSTSGKTKELLLQIIGKVNILIYSDNIEDNSANDSSDSDLS